MRQDARQGHQRPRSVPHVLSGYRPPPPRVRRTLDWVVTDPAYAPVWSFPPEQLSAGADPTRGDFAHERARWQAHDDAVAREVVETMRRMGRWYGEDS